MFGFNKKQVLNSYYVTGMVYENGSRTAFRQTIHVAGRDLQDCENKLEKQLKKLNADNLTLIHTGDAEVEFNSKNTSYFIP